MLRRMKITAVCVFLALCGPVWAIEVDDPIAHWKLDEGSGTIAYDSAGTNNGTLVNGPIWTTGQINGALSFDGVNDYVDVGDPPDGSLDFGAGDSFTIAAWIKWNKTVYDQRDATIVHKVRTDSGGYNHEGYSLKVWMGTLFFGFGDIGGARTQIRGVTDVNDNTWYHVVGVRDTATDKVYVYVDGGSDATPVTDTTTSTLANSNRFGIGRTQDYYQTYFGGIIDDVRVYNRALSAEEVRELYLGRTLVGLDIVGPNEVPDNNSIQYTAMATYDDNSTEDVTLEASWSVDANDIASIDANGVLTTGQLETLEKLILISAEYTEGDANAAAQMDVVIYADCTIAELINRNINGAITVKQRIMEDIDEAVEKEARAMLLLGRFATDPSLSRLRRNDFVHVRNNTAAAIRKETDGRSGIGQSVGLLQEVQSIIDGDLNSP